MNESGEGGRPIGAVALLVVGIFGISTATLWARLSESAPGELAFRRLALTVPILWALTRWKKTPTPSIDVARCPVLVSGICLAVHFWAYFASLARLPDAAAVTLVFVSMHPILLLGVEVARGDVRLEGVRTAGVFLALFGSIWIVREELVRPEGSVFGVLLGILSAFGMVGYLWAGRSAQRFLPATIYAQRSYAVAAAWLGLGIFMAGRSLLPETPREWGIAGLLALFPTVLGHTPMNAALRHLPATVVSTAFLGEAVGAPLLVWLALDEVPPSGFWAGGIAVVTGIAVVVLRGRGDAPPRAGGARVGPTRSEAPRGPIESEATE